MSFGELEWGGFTLGVFYGVERGCNLVYLIVCFVSPPLDLLRIETPR